MDLARWTTCTFPLRERPYPEAFAILAATGLPRLDVWGRAPHFSADPAECDPDAFAAAAASAGVTIANLGTYCGLDYDAADPAVVVAAHETMAATIALARRFGARSLRVTPGHGEDPAVVDQVAPHFRTAARLAGEAGVFLAIENHRGSIAGRPELARRLCELVDSPWFGIIYEPCNLLHAGVDYREAFEVFHEWIVHVHFKDGRTTPDGFQRCHLGEGEVEVRWCLDALDRVGYAGDLALEYEICDVEPLETGLVRWREFVERL